MKALARTYATDGFTSHLPQPVLRVETDGFRVLLEPVAIWRLLLHLLPRCPTPYVEDNLVRILNREIDRWVRPTEVVHIPGAKGTTLFNQGLTSWLRRCYGAANAMQKPKIATAIKRQIRILNPDFQERDIPNEVDAERLRIRDPRELFKDIKPGPGAVMPSATPLTDEEAEQANIVAQALSGSDENFEDL